MGLKETENDLIPIVKMLDIANASILTVRGKVLRKRYATLFS